jgi:cell division protein FtsB
MPIDRGGPCRLRFTYEQVAEKLEQAHAQIESLRASNQARESELRGLRAVAKVAVYQPHAMQWVIDEADLLCLDPGSTGAIEMSYYTSEQLAKDIALLQAAVKHLQDENKRLRKSLLGHRDVGRLPDILRQVIDYDPDNRQWVIYDTSLGTLNAKELKTLQQVLPK